MAKRPSSLSLVGTAVRNAPIVAELADAVQELDRHIDLSDLNDLDRLRLCYLGRRTFALVCATEELSSAIRTDPNHSLHDVVDDPTRDVQIWTLSNNEFEALWSLPLFEMGPLFFGRTRLPRHPGRQVGTIIADAEQRDLLLQALEELLSARQTEAEAHASSKLIQKRRQLSSRKLSDSIGKLLPNGPDIAVSLQKNYISFLEANKRLSKFEKNIERLIAKAMREMSEPAQELFARRLTSALEEAERFDAASAGREAEALLDAPSPSLSTAPSRDTAKEATSGRETYKPPGYEPFQGVRISGPAIAYLEKWWRPHIKSGQVCSRQDIRDADERLLMAIYRHCREHQISPDELLPPARKQEDLSDLSADARLERIRRQTALRTRRTRQRKAPTKELG